jgi:hypothetical protein
MFTTSIPLSPAYVSASTDGCRKKNPESWPARRLTSVTSGATPATPRSLIGEPTMLATCVPCEFSSTSAGSLHEPSGSSAQSPSTSGMSVVKFRLSVLLKFAAMSGWLPSIPVSMIPTSTPSPRSIACEPSAVAWIIFMPHCLSASGSPAAAIDAVPTEVSALSAVPRAAARASASWLSEPIGFPSACPTGRSSAAPKSARCRRTSARKPGFLDVAVATPTLRFSRTIVPPAASTASRAAAGDASAA